MAGAVSLAAVLLASGHGKRFGGDKLFYDYGGKPMVERAFLSVPDGVFTRVCAVSRSEKVLALAGEYGFVPVPNGDLTDDVAVTIRLGIGNLPEGTDGCMFLVCDQPALRRETVAALAAAFFARPDRIWALSFAGKRGNPVIFPSALFGELASLPYDTGGRAVIDRHHELLSLMEAGDGAELDDIDAPPNDGA